jgi:hypothetical protein
VERLLMEFLSEDPTYLGGTLGLLAGAFLIALKMTQQGKYLTWAGVSLGLALLVVAVEQVWVTDNERIEEVVYKLSRAVEASDVPAVLGQLTPDVQYVTGGTTVPGDATRALVERSVSNATFDFLRIAHLRASAGGQSRRGTAEFKVITSGSYQSSYNQLNFGSHNSTWSLGLRETTPGVWKVSRITPVDVPGGQAVLSVAAREGSRPSTVRLPASLEPSGRGRGRARPGFIAMP